jgi:hypothetical protein
VIRVLSWCWQPGNGFAAANNPTLETERRKTSKHLQSPWSHSMLRALKIESRCRFQGADL